MYLPLRDELTTLEMPLHTTITNDVDSANQRRRYVAFKCDTCSLSCDVYMTLIKKSVHSIASVTSGIEIRLGLDQSCKHSGKHCRLLLVSELTKNKQNASTSYAAVEREKERTGSRLRSRHGERKSET